MSNYNNELVSWIRDFAAANHDGFEPEQIQRLNDAANTIETLIAERDDARMLYCHLKAEENSEIYGESNQTPQEVADSMGWDVPELRVETTQYWCDNCANPISANDAFHYAELPCDIASANKGESGTICRECEAKLEANRNNDDFRTSDMS